MAVLSKLTSSTVTKKVVLATIGEGIGRASGEGKITENNSKK